MKFYVVLFLMASLSACTARINPFTVSEAQDGEPLIVYTRNSASTYYNDDRGEPAGFEYELISAFAKDHQMKVEFRVVDTTQEVISAIVNQKGHIGAAGLTNTKERRKFLAFSPSYHAIHQQVVCFKNHSIGNEKDLQKLRYLVPNSTSQLERLNRLKKSFAKMSIDKTEMESELIFQQIQGSEDLCTVVDENILALNRHLFPELYVVYTFNEPDELAWALPLEHHKLQKKLLNWFSVRGKLRAQQLIKKYFHGVGSYDRFDIKTFIDAIDQTLPKYQKYFQKYGEANNIDWRLLAAIGYQESHWNPLAKSYSGVRGLMMLTSKTAQQVGVKDRLNPEQSIKGGAEYLAHLRSKTPEYVSKDSQMWFALAAYNVGFYHLRDAMALTVLEGLDPRKWANVRSVLPKLSEPKYFNKTRYGYARGMEPVVFTSRIASYYKILKERYQ